MNYLCPVCQHSLTEENDKLVCTPCRQDYRLVACCPTCHQPVEVLKACGAVDYFCPHGDGLISQKKVAFIPKPVTDR